MSKSTGLAGGVAQTKDQALRMGSMEIVARQITTSPLVILAPTVTSSPKPLHEDSMKSITLDHVRH
jgi:hypothetical protein